MKKFFKILLIFFVILGIGFSSILYFVPGRQICLKDETPPKLAFPIQGGDENITGFNGFNISNWGEPGVYHNGIDLVVSPNNWTGILAVANGTIIEIKSKTNPYSNPPNAVMYTLKLEIACGWTAYYVIESYPTTEQEIRLVEDHIFVNVGDTVQTGDLIAQILVTEHDYIHLHFSLFYNFDVVCPYLYSSTEAQAIYDSLAAKYNKTVCCTDVDQPGCVD